MKRIATFIAIAVLAPTLALAQTDWSKVEVKATKLAGNVWMLRGAGGNIGVSAGPDGVLIVDDQFAPLAEKIHAALKEINPGKLKFVLNTHFHGDHTGGNVVFGLEAPVIAQTNVRKRLEVPEDVHGMHFDALPENALPVVTFDRSLSIHFNGEEIEVIHYPHGHTDGDSVIFFTGSNVIHMGDDFWNGMFPFVDLENGGNVDGMIHAVDSALEKASPGAKIIPGHGPLGSIADLEAFRSMLVETTRIVRGEMAEGKTLDEMKKAGLPEQFQKWSTKFIDTSAWIETIYKRK
ncbi:MAG: MBL fold metallo-hydrolase [Thermoanaerobaculia bacterium]